MQDVLPFDDVGPIDPVDPTPATDHEGRLVGVMRLVYGDGPDGATCGQCAHLYARQVGGRRFYKCHLGPQTRTATTDWRCAWAACGHFERSPYLRR